MKYIFLFINLFTVISLIGQNKEINNNYSFLHEDNSFYSLCDNNTIILSVKEDQTALCRINNTLIRGVIQNDSINNICSFVSHNRNNDFRFSIAKVNEGLKINSWKNPPIKISKDLVLIPVDNNQNQTEVLAHWFTKENDNYKLSFGNAKMLNDKASHLCQSNCYKEALMISTLVRTYSSNYIESYVSQGDAYWGLGDKENASKAYKNYVEIMKACGKKDKISPQIIQRINASEVKG